MLAKFMGRQLREDRTTLLKGALMQALKGAEHQQTAGQGRISSLHMQMCFRAAVPRIAFWQATGRIQDFPCRL